ncbi:hypothetical protein [Georgenia sp. H159]|uniref:hypothetical protein n=1 Tax=Georgenia sp. H159 TaxID=3076115 RepID=UPI002D771D4A|nr:hypothetical protein [Georgenia sp. H159]
MTEQSGEAPEPRGTESAGTAELGEPERAGREVPQGDVDVDLNARQERISERRKAAGPGMREEEGRESPDDAPPSGEESNPDDPA